MQALQDQLAALFDQNASVASVGDNNWNLRLRYLNRAQEEWVEQYNWPNLFTEYNIQASTPTSMATLPLPRNFRKLASFPKISDGTTSWEYTEIRPEEKSRYTTSDRFCFVLGNPGSFNLIVNPGSITSGVSIYVPYYLSPASLASPADIPLVPNSDYLIYKALSYLFSGRDDEKRGEYEGLAQRTLAQMINYEAGARGDAYDNRTESWLEKRWGFKVGRD